MTDRPSDELVARMVELVRKAASYVSPYAQYSAVRDHLGDEARAIVADLPPPVDPDLEEAREICARRYEEEGCPETAAIYRGGGYDDALADTLAGIKRGRELERGAR